MKSRTYALSFGALKLSQSTEEQRIEVYTPAGSVVFTGKDLEALKKAAASLKEIKRKPGRQPQKKPQAGGTSKQVAAATVDVGAKNGHGNKPSGGAEKIFLNKLGVPSANGHRSRAVGRRKGAGNQQK